MAKIDAGSDHLYPKVQLAGDAVDPYSGCQGVIASPHLHIHGGKVFHWAQKVTGIANAATLSFLLKTVALNFPHIHRFRISVGDGDVDVLMNEDTVTSADGTQLTNIYNLNRNSSNTPDTEIYSGPTITDPGTELHNLWIPPSGSQGAHIEGVSDAEAGEEWILAPSKNYSFQLVNNSGGIISAWFELFWYEL